MSKQKLLVGVLLPVMFVCGTAFGWGGPSHSAMCHQVFDDAVVSPLLSAISNVSTIEDYIGEPGDWQQGQWDNVNARAYIPGIASPNGKDWDSLDETTRLKYMMHNCGDVAVPVGHSPACYNPNGYTNTVGEAALEAQVSTWGTYPDIEGTSSWYNDETNTTYSYTGTITDVLTEHYSACRNNRDWFKAQPKPWYLFGAHTPSANHDAGWNGTAIAQLLMRAMIVDYILAKQDVVTVWETYPISYVGSNITLSQQGAYDPDCVSWNSNGTYSQVYGCNAQGIQYCLWDVNGDVASGGDWDYGAYATDLTLPVSTLLALGVPTNEWSLYYTAVVDNENNVGYAADYMWIYGSAPEPASLSLLAIGGLALLRRKK